MQKSLDDKLADIHANPHRSKAFILADAKDADMAFGVGAPGMSPETHAGEVRSRTLAEYRDQIREIVRQGLVDIMLMSASTSDKLTIGERCFDASKVTPAARANDASDVWAIRGERYTMSPALPFRSATLDHIQCGHVDCKPDERALGANLGLYSVTFNNRLDDDLRTLSEYGRFREEAERKGFRHFLEVFAPNAPFELAQEKLAPFINDHIARSLAGVSDKGRPIFLKIPFLGPAAMSELVAYDPHLVVGILGGSAGTTYDAFKLLAEAKKYGARAALFGRKINNAECQLAFVEFLHLILQDVISPEEAVRAYHAVLGKLKIAPRRPLADDLAATTAALSYAGGSSLPVSVTVPASTAPQAAAANKMKENGSSAKACHCGCGGKESSGKSCAGDSAVSKESGDGYPLRPDGSFDFAKMTRKQKLRYNQEKRDRLFGRLES